jgi:branched-chain amino acid transport system permease protein
MKTLSILSIIIIGGTGNTTGPLLGTLLLLFLPEALRFLGMPDAIAANMRQVIYGLVIIVMLRFRPQGLRGEYRFA